MPVSTECRPCQGASHQRLRGTCIRESADPPAGTREPGFPREEPAARGDRVVPTAELILDPTGTLESPRSVPGGGVNADLCGRAAASVQSIRVDVSGDPGGGAARLNHVHHRQPTLARWTAHLRIVAVVRSGTNLRLDPDPSSTHPSSTKPFGDRGIGSMVEAGASASGNESAAVPRSVLRTPPHAQRTPAGGAPRGPVEARGKWPSPRRAPSHVVTGAPIWARSSLTLWIQDERRLERFLRARGYAHPLPTAQGGVSSDTTGESTPEKASQSRGSHACRGW
jgi:hypothetical protein